MGLTYLVSLPMQWGARRGVRGTGHLRVELCVSKCTLFLPLQRRDFSGSEFSELIDLKQGSIFIDSRRVPLFVPRLICTYRFDPDFVEFHGKCCEDQP
jgi:hypothetical protein